MSPHPPPEPATPQPDLSSSSPLPPPLFTSPRLAYRSFHPSDAQTLSEICAPAPITKYMSLAFAHPYTLSHAQTWIALNLSSQLPNYVFTPRDSPATILGSVGFKPGADVHTHTADIGYWVAENEWGKGYAGEAVEAAVAYGFTVMGWGKISAGVFAPNEASMRVLEKAGFVREGVLRGHVVKHGEKMDMVVFGLLREEWEEKRDKRIEGMA